MPSTLLRRSKKIGRNDPCPCGSGMKFKKCCLKKMEPKTRHAPPAVMAKARVILQKKMEAERKRVERFGEVYPIGSTVAFGKRLVPVGNKIYATDIQNYVSDFLREYVGEVFGSEWFRDESGKPEAERHLISQWRTESNRYMSTQPMQLDGSRRGVPSGVTAAFRAFAYDLYIVAHHDGLDDLLLHRLKNCHLFQGARHELFVEATCLRGGFSIEREDEKDRRIRHTEFTALHKASGQKLSVEAKSRHRAGVLATPGPRKSHDPLIRGFARLINDAVSKKPTHPLVIFFDTNLPFDAADELLARQPGDIPSRLMNRLLKEIKKQHGGKDPYSMIVFSNHPHHYAAKDEKDPQKHLLSVESDDSLADSAALWSLHNAAMLYGNVPNEFPTNN